MLRGPSTVPDSAALDPTPTVPHTPIRPSPRISPLSIRPRDLLPGLLVAATGVGAGDLITASLAGSELGVAILWAAVVGAVLKASLNEGLARWQLATGETLVHAWVHRLPPILSWMFLVYLLLWSFVVGGALVNACGIAASGWLPVGDADTSRLVWGVAHGLGGLALVRLGSFRFFETLMAVCIAAMFGCVVLTAVLLDPDWGAVGRGLITPTVPEGGLAWVLGVLGGVGGTVTLLSYGYWIREHGREGDAGLRSCRVDLAVAYGMTALFGVAMILIGSRLELSGKGAGVALALGEQLELTLGPVGRAVFLAGFWGAVFSSLLGVWQGVPYLFGDFVAALRERRTQRGGAPLPEGEGDGDALRRRAARRFQLGLALLPLPLLAYSFRGVQLTYAVLGAVFMPFLAGTLLYLNNRSDWIGTRHRTRWLGNTLLALTLVFFGWEGVRAWLRAIEG